MQLMNDIREDAKRLQPNRLECRHLIKLFITTSPFSASVIYRLSHASGKVFPGLGRSLSRINLLLHGVDIDFRADIGPGVLLQHPVGVVIGRDCSIGREATLMSGVVLGRRDIQRGPDLGAYPIVGEYVVFGTGSVALGAIAIGSYSKVGAKALILADVPPRTTVTGIHGASAVAN